MGQEIRFIRNKEGKRGIAVSLAGTVYISETPVEIEVKESGGGFHLYRSGYEKAEEQAWVRIIAEECCPHWACPR